MDHLLSREKVGYGPLSPKSISDQLVGVDLSSSRYPVVKVCLYIYSLRNRFMPNVLVWVVVRGGIRS